MPKRKARRIFTVQAEGSEYSLGLGGPIVAVLERASGTGSLDKVTIKGQVYHRVRFWTENAKGVRERKNLYAKTEAGALKKLAALKKAPTARRDASKITLESYLKTYFIPGVETRIRSNTLTAYSNAVHKHIVPRIGKAKFATLGPSNVSAWLGEMAADKKVGPRAAQQSFMVLKRAYNYAVELELLDRHPFPSVKAPAAPKREQRILNGAQLLALLNEAAASPWYSLLYLTIATSLREGELLGLRWSDLNWNERYLRVNVAAVQGRVGLELAEPKTKASRRRVDLPDEAVATLKEHKERQVGPNPLDLVFPGGNGQIYDRANVKRALYRLLDNAKLPRATFHSLRHAGNTLLAESGVPLKVLQARLGHATSKVTLDVYSHVSDDAGRVAADTIGGLLKRTKAAGKSRSSGLNRGLTRSKRAASKTRRTKKKAL
jgi:integrase